jgi:hypothetical protein
MTVDEALPFLVPIGVLQMALLLFALWDLSRPERRVRGGSKLVWGIIVFLVGVIGPLVYFVVGREDA